MSFAGLASTDGSPLTMSHPVLDPAIQLTGILGLPLSPKMQLLAAFDLGKIFHARFPGSSLTTTPSVNTLRFGLRMGFGG